MSLNQLFDLFFDFTSARKIEQWFNKRRAQLQKIEERLAHVKWSRFEKWALFHSALCLWEKCLLILLRKDDDGSSWRCSGWELR